MSRSRLKYFLVLGLVAITGHSAGAGIPSTTNAYPIGPSGAFGYIPYGSPYLTTGAGSTGVGVIKRLISTNSNSSANTFDSFFYNGSAYHTGTTKSAEILGVCVTSGASAASTLAWTYLTATGVGSMTEGGTTAPTSPTYYCPGGTGCLSNSTTAGVPTCTVTHDVVGGGTDTYIMKKTTNSFTVNSQFYEMWIREF